MAKTATVEAPAPASAPTSVPSIKRVFRTPEPVKAPTVTDPLYVPGKSHNIIIDRRKPDEIAVLIGTDEECLANHFRKGGDGPELLALTMGAMFDSVELDIGGQRYFLAVKLTKHVPKKKGA